MNPTDSPTVSSAAGNLSGEALLAARAVSFEVLRRIAVGRARFGKRALAEAVALRAALPVYASAAEVHLQLGLRLLAMGDHLTALGHFLMAEELDPNDSAVAHALASLMLHFGRPAQAARRLSAATSRTYGEPWSDADARPSMAESVTLSGFSPRRSTRPKPLRSAVRPVSRRPRRCA